MSRIAYLNETISYQTYLPEPIHIVYIMQDELSFSIQESL